MQYAFARVKDPNVSRISFELIPHIHPHSERAPQVRSDQLVRRGCPCRPQGSLPLPFQRSSQLPPRNPCCHQRSQRGKLAHFFTQTRPHAPKADVDSTLIMNRVGAASGVHYSAQKEAPRKYEPIAPVGTNYQPVGKVDISALRAGASSGPPPAPAASKPAVKSTARPVPLAPSSAPGFGRAPIANKAPADAWPDESTNFSPPPPPAAPRPTPSAPRPAASASVSVRSYLCSCLASDQTFASLLLVSRQPHLHPPRRRMCQRNRQMMIGSVLSVLHTPPSNYNRRN